MPKKGKGKRRSRKNNPFDLSLHDFSLTSATSSPASSIHSKEIPDIVSEQYKETEDITAEQFNEECEVQPKYRARFFPNSDKIAHLLVKELSDGSQIAEQFEPPENTEIKVRPLKNLEVFPVDDIDRYRAETPKGTKMHGNRRLNVEIDQEGVFDRRTMIFFSPVNRCRATFWGHNVEESTETLSRFLKPELREDIKNEQSDLKTHEKIRQMPMSRIDRDSVIWRTENDKRNQNKVMGSSAWQAIESFLDTHGDEISQQLRERIQLSLEHVSKLNMLAGYMRGEWLHALAWSLTNIKVDPQVRGNLGAAPKWANTEMMLLEGVAKYFAKHSPCEKTDIYVKPLFEMLMGTDVIDKIKYEVHLKYEGNYLRFFQEINPWAPMPPLRKKTDIGQANLISRRLLNNEQPISELPIVRLKNQYVYRLYDDLEESSNPEKQTARKRLRLELS